MSVGIFGKKIGMTQIFGLDGTSIPITIVQAERCYVTHIKSKDRDGYNAIQVAFAAKEAYSLIKPMNLHVSNNCLVHLPPSLTTGPLLPIIPSGRFKYAREFRVNVSRFNLSDYRIGQVIDIFPPGQKVNITGKSIGKGFTGNQKRHNFSRGPMTHGSKNHRLPGSIGAGSTPGRVYPGKKMAGRLGNKYITIKNQEIIHSIPNENKLFIKGSLPGKKNNLLRITPI